jgi:hypothetical protein
MVLSQKLTKRVINTKTDLSGSKKTVRKATLVAQLKAAKKVADLRKTLFKALPAQKKVNEVILFATEVALKKVST